MAKRWLDNKSLLRVLSLCVAIIIWLYVVITQDPPRTNRVNSVEVISGLNQFQLNEGLNIISKSGDTVSFTASGKRSLVTGVKGSYYAKLNLDQITQPGKYSIYPEISKPEGVTVTGVNPSVIEVHVDKYVSSLLPIQIKTKGELQSGIQINRMTAEIQQASVTVPSLSLEQISYVGLTVDLSSVTSSTTNQCVPVLFDKDNKPMVLKTATIDQKSIGVVITAEKSKTVPIKAVIKSDGLDISGMKAELSVSSIEVHGDAQIMDTMQSIETMPLILTHMPQIDEQFEVNLSIPDGIALKDVANAQIIVKFKKT